MTDASGSQYDIGVQTRRAVLMQVAVYAGVPAAVAAFRTAKRALSSQ